jgi:hypothetical protein
VYISDTVRSRRRRREEINRLRQRRAAFERQEQEIARIRNSHRRTRAFHRFFLNPSAVAAAETQRRSVIIDPLTSSVPSRSGDNVSQPLTPPANRPSDSSTTSPHINEHSYSLVGQLTPDTSNDVRATEHSYSLASIGALEAPPPLYHRHSNPNTGLRRSNRLSSQLGPRLTPSNSSSVRVRGSRQGSGNATELSRTGQNSASSQPASQDDQTSRVMNQSLSPLGMSSLAIVRVPSDLGLGGGGGDRRSLQFDDDDASYTITFHAFHPMRAEPGGEDSSSMYINASMLGSTGNTPSTSVDNSSPAPAVNSNPLNVRADAAPDGSEGRDSGVDTQHIRPVMPRAAVQGPFSSLPSSMQYLTSASDESLPSTNAVGGPDDTSGQEGMVADYIRSVSREAEILGQNLLDHNLEFINSRSRARRSHGQQQSSPDPGHSTLRVPPALYARDLSYVANNESGEGGSNAQPSSGAGPNVDGWRPISLEEYNRIRYRSGLVLPSAEGVAGPSRRSSSRVRPRAMATVPSEDVRPSQSDAVSVSPGGHDRYRTVPDPLPTTLNPWNRSSLDETQSSPQRSPHAMMGVPATADNDVIVVDSDSDEVCVCDCLWCFFAVGVALRVSGMHFGL